MIQTSFKRNPSLNFAMIQKEKCRPKRKVVGHLPSVSESANFFFTKPHCYYFVVPFYAYQFVSDFQIVLQKLRVLWQQKRILTLCDIQKGPQRFQWETTYYQSVITFWTN